jgi:CubicO group peptidase (beta-lactamase class C family)
MPLGRAARTSFYYTNFVPRISSETPQEPIQRDTDVGQLLRALAPKGRFFSYRLGFILEEYGGHKLIWHAGNIDGMSAALAVLPAEHVGVVVLSNMDSNWAPEAVMFHEASTDARDPVGSSHLRSVLTGRR